jgi:NAD(P)-dependent dehydrogenase (short-subunit alcohol dehydrogenase family)
MARVFITGSADGLGRAAAQTLLNDGHEVVVHARNRDRLTAVRDLLDRGAAAVVGDLSDLEETRGLARDVNRLGRLDAVIHNAGVYTGPHACRSTSSLRTCSPRSSTARSGWSTSPAASTAADDPA